MSASTRHSNIVTQEKRYANDTLDMLFNENDGILITKEEPALLPVLDSDFPSNADVMIPDIDLDALLNEGDGGKDILEDILASPEEDSSPSPTNDSMLGSPPFVQPTPSIAPDLHAVSQDHCYLPSDTAFCNISFGTEQKKINALDADSPSHVDIPVYITDDLRQLEARQRSAPGPIRHSRRSRGSSGSNSGLPYTVHDLAVISGSPSSDSFVDDDVSRSSGSRYNDDSYLGLPGERLILTDEERLLLAKEGLDLPDRLPLTREEERVLRTVRRKIRNKISAKNSRLKKQEYVVGLEQRVKLCSKENRSLRGSVDSLRSQNRQLMTELRRLRQWIGQRFPEMGSMRVGGAAKTGLYALFLSFALVLTPMLSPFWPSDDTKMAPVLMGKPSVMPGRNRMLLQEREAAVQLGDPYHITVRPVGPPWQNPPKTAAISLHAVPSAPVPAKPSDPTPATPNVTNGAAETMEDAMEEDTDVDSRGNEL